MSEIHSIDAEDDQFAYRYDTQLLIDKRDKDLDEDEISDYITEHFEGNSLIAAGDEDLVKIHFHTNEPWKILEYCNTVGEIYDIVVAGYDSSDCRITRLINRLRQHISASGALIYNYLLLFTVLLFSSSRHYCKSSKRYHEKH